LAVSDSKKAGATYIFRFYEQIQNLNHYQALYLNLLSELSYKYGKDPESIGDEEEAKNALLEMVQNLRYYVNLTYTTFSSLKRVLKTEKQLTTDIDSCFTLVQTQFIIKREAALLYCIYMNEALLKDVIQNLLKTSEDYLEELYKNEQREDNTTA
jgi:predicted rRNA methylase YqxC with S4 and FtsJ domains